MVELSTGASFGALVIGVAVGAVGFWAWIKVTGRTLVKKIKMPPEA